jgi:hypothetical protein
MKTAMQELIDSYHSIDKFTDFDTWIANNEKKLLEKEKEQIMMAFNDGKINSVLKKRDSLDYYNQTYNQNK